MQLKINLKYVFFLLCFIVFIFQNYLQTIFPIFSYFDELFSLLFFPIFIYKFCKGKIKNNKIINISFLICIIGLISSLLNNYQNLSTIFSDMIIFEKFFFTMYISSILFDKEFLDKHRRKTIFCINSITFILTILTCVNYIFKIFPGEIRYGIMSNSLFYSHPTYLASVCIFLIAMNLLLKNRMISLSNIVLFVMLLSTLRAKAIASAVVAIIICAYVIKNNKKISFSKLFVIGALLFVVFFRQFSYYFFSDGFARKELTVKSICIANDHFPFGAGFGSYGSYYSTVNYSPVYYMYGLNNVWGLSPNYSAYATDTFWPMVIGQFGYIGAILYLVIIVLIFLKIQNDFTVDNKYYYCSKILCFSYLIISSIAETAFVNPLAIPLALLLGFNVEEHREDINNE